MVGIGGDDDFQVSQQDIMSSSGILYTSSSNLNYPDAELRKNCFQDLPMDLHPYNHHHHQQQQLQGSSSSNSGLARLRSAPSSFFGDLITGGVGGGFDDFRYFRPSSPDMDAIFSRLLSPTGDGNHHDPLLLPPSASAAPELQGFVKQEVIDSSFQQNLGNGSSGEWKDHGGVSAATFMDPIDLGTSVASAAAVNSNNNNTSNNGTTNLARHNSSPAGLFSSLVVDNGFHGIGEVSRNNSTSGRLSSSRTTSFSTSAPRLLPQISEIGEETFKTSPNSGKRLCSSDSWDFASLDGIKRLKQDNDGDDLDFFSTLNAMDNLQQQKNGSNGGNRLTHHLSLPKTAAEMASVEKFLQLQGSVPCRTRAKRGFATHPRSIAERVRRTKISERMRKLQDLFPKSDKQTNTAEMLDLAVEYIKDLQKQVKSMKDTKARCTCLREEKA